jgi:hypothetical protein
MCQDTIRSGVHRAGGGRSLEQAAEVPMSHDRRRYSEIQILQLREHQIYPEGDALNPWFLSSDRKPLLDRTTPIASIGSCFAREIKDYLTAAGYNYVQVAHGPHARHGSAAWDRVYNTFCLRQEFERALGVFDPCEAAWRLADGTLGDPYRKGVHWTDDQTREADLAEHRRTAREALTRARVLIITIGLNEIWYGRDDGSVFFQVPPPEAFDSERHAFRTATVEENVENLERARALLAEANPDCYVIITVSPVPLRATFSVDQNVIVSDAESKAVLLVAAKELARRHESVDYFPAFEIVRIVAHDPFLPDNRHVRPEVVAEIMRVFEAVYVKDTGARPKAAPGVTIESRAHDERRPSLLSWLRR